MIEFWNGLILGQKIFLCIAVPSTMLLIIQIIMIHLTKKQIEVKY